MKTKSLLIAILCVACVMGCAAQKKVKKDKKGKESVETVKEEQKPVVEEVPVITEECIMNISLFQQSAKNKQYADAVDPWYQVYNTCPNANRAIYTRGDDIIGWQISQAKTEEEKSQYKATLMKMYDSWIKWFGDDPKYPTAYILGQKAMDYCNYFTEDELKEPAYGWLKESIKGLGTESSLNVVNTFADLAYGIYKSNPEKNAEQYIADYQLATDVLNKIASDPKNSYAANAKSYKDYIDNMFAVSGAADCAKLDELYAQTVQNSINDLDMLGKIMKLYRRVGCTESDVYFAAAESSHKLQPTAESAAGCASMSAKKGNIQDAISYYEQAIALSDDNQDKANYYFNCARYSYDIKQYQDVRKYARQSLALDENNGKCYIMIGLAYAAANPYPDDAVLNRTKYWAAVDKFVKAKQVDPSIEEEANNYIRTYSRYFPSQDDIFFKPELGKGKPFTVGGWIGETTTCR